MEDGHQIRVKQRKQRKSKLSLARAFERRKIVLNARTQSTLDQHFESIRSIPHNTYNEFQDNGNRLRVNGFGIELTIPLPKDSLQWHQQREFYEVEAYISQPHLCVIDYYRRLWRKKKETSSKTITTGMQFEEMMLISKTIKRLNLWIDTPESCIDEDFLKHTSKCSGHENHDKLGNFVLQDLVSCDNIKNKKRISVIINGTNPVASQPCIGNSSPCQTDKCRKLETSKSLDVKDCLVIFVGSGHGKTTLIRHVQQRYPNYIGKFFDTDHLSPGVKIPPGSIVFTNRTCLAREKSNVGLYFISDHPTWMRRVKRQMYASEKFYSDAQITRWRSHALTIARGTNVIKCHTNRYLSDCVKIKFTPLDSSITRCSE